MEQVIIATPDMTKYHASIKNRINAENELRKVEEVILNEKTAWQDFVRDLPSEYYVHINYEANENIHRERGVWSIRYGIDPEKSILIVEYTSYGTFSGTYPIGGVGILITRFHQQKKYLEEFVVVDRLIKAERDCK